MATTKAVITQSYLTAIGDAIREKDGTTAKLAPSAMAQAIKNIPQGAAFGEWTPPSDWPDIRKILTDNWPADKDYDAACIELMYGAYITDATFGGTVTYIVNSNGVVNTTSNSNGFSTTETGLRWVAKYGYHDGITLANSGTKLGSLWVHLQNVDFQSNPSALSYADSIRAITGSVNVNYSGYFSVVSDNCLQIIPELNIGDGCAVRPTGFSPVLVDFNNDEFDFSSLTTIEDMFSGCRLLTKVVDVLDLTSCTNSNNAFNNMLSLRKLPTHLTANGDYSLAIKFNGVNGYHVEIDTIATFDDDGNVNGGMAYNLNDLTGSTKPPTVTFSSTIKSRFTTDQQTAVEDAFSDKNWTLAW